MKDYTLEVKDLNKTYSKFKLTNINLNLEKGKIMGFIGPNGSGKSTTIKAIMNIIPYDSGTIKIENKSMIGNEIELKKSIGYVGEHLDFYEKVKLSKIYKFTKKFYDTWDEDLFRSLINRFEIDLDKKMNQLSKGMVVKFSLAMVLAHHPKLLILDEPTSGLDPVIRDDLLEILSEIAKKEESSVLFSSHITEDIVKIADDVAFIYNGKIRLIDRKRTILEEYVKIESDLLKDMDTNHKIIMKNTETTIINKNDLVGISNQALRGDKITLDELLLFMVKTQNILKTREIF